jgi:hypothetical protein
MLRVDPAVLMVSGVKDSTIPPWVTSTGIEVNTSAGVRYPRAWWGRSVL